MIPTTMSKDHPIPSLLSLSPSGQPRKQYILCSESNDSKQKPLLQPWRQPQNRKKNPALDQMIALLKEVFLPTGYPTSVSSDYTKYQIYDSLQAFSSTIASLLSSRAVLTGIGVGDSTATATSALLLHILQDSTGRLATILFAHQLGAALEPETKMYRLMADVFNDISIILDCASPALPRGFIRVSVLSCAGVLRALCGVAAGATKASLSVHFAQGGDGTGNVGELNAKDASQETVISLLGSLVGSLVVSFITGPVATWTTLLALLGIHLFMNWKAVRAINMKTLNKQRAGLVFGDLFTGKGVRSPREISQRERIFERDGIVRNTTGKAIGWIQIGVSIERIANLLPSYHHHDQNQSQDEDHDLNLTSLTSLTKDSNYTLYLSTQTSSLSKTPTILISLSTLSTAHQQLEAYAHGTLLLHKLSMLSPTTTTTKPNGANQQQQEQRGIIIPPSTLWGLLQRTREILTSRWEDDMRALTDKGWDLGVGGLEVRAGYRYRYHC